ncbi:hybrid sensor histidine kinase/response regulator [Cohnella terricola]|uniref:histidine kinase n=1 Tax=Cohnella terricola TaxID=1289167 RepID=A0A559JAL7_9BACL|nr:ATP-binding protein [Cohnella terricola]TVX96897.1 response regulator [Cohnella terricola]
MTNTRKTIFILGCFILALTGLRLCWLFLSSPNKAQVIQGTADLREWDFSSNQTVLLNGEWEFFPYRFIMNPAEALSPNERGEALKVPGKWDAKMEEGNSTFGYGSYRLRIHVASDGERIYGIRIPLIPSSSELFVNGRLLAQAGQPGTEADRYSPGVVPYIGSFVSDRDEIEVVIQVANYDDLNGGGIYGRVQIGSDRAVHRASQISADLQMTVVLILAVHGIYSVLLYFMGLRERGLLYFFLLVLSGMATVLVDDDRLLLAVFSVNYEWMIKLRYLAYVGSAAFLLQFVRHLLTGRKLNKVIRIYLAICAVYAVSALFLPSEILTLTDGIHTLIILFSYLIVPVIAFRSFAQKNSNAIFILLGLTTLTLNLIWGLIRASGWLDMGYYPIDIIFVFICFASYWFKHYLHNSAQTAKLAERLIDEDRRKDQFLVRTSHELRNPLHGILNIAHTVIDSGHSPSEGENRENMKLLVTVGRRMSLLLNDLMDIARLKENRIRLQLANVQVQALVSGVLDMVRFTVEGKPIRLLNQVPDTFPPVVADENRLIQVLFNLLHNAAKFTNEGTIVVAASVREGQAFITVSDTGIGMNAETLRTAFDPYVQGESSSSGDVAEGIGLGLSICKQLVELHGSELTVESTPGQGSTFTFALPISEASGRRSETPGMKAADTVAMQETAATSTVTPAERNFGRLSDRAQILAVDDDPINLSVLERVLSSEDYDIVKTTSGSEALSLIAGREWDLIIADVMMPGMSGYQLSSAVRERFTLSEMPILLLTARSQPEDIEAGFRAGANDYLIKPVDGMELKSRVRALTDGRRSFRERVRMEGAWLQAQIQPHFLFNTLNSIAALSEIDTARMRNLLEVFGNYLRASFNPRNMERFVTLQQELELVRSYLYIEKERFEERLQVEWEVEEGIRLSIPPLSIQPLVENAVRHGVLKRAGGGKVRIRISDCGDYVEVEVEDDGVGMDEHAVRRALGIQGGRARGIGLRNTDRRLRQLYGQGLRIRSVPGRGTRISFFVMKSQR